MRVLIIVPCYNEEVRLNTNEFYKFTQNSNATNFLFVDDGSDDGTSNIIKGLSDTSSKLSFLSLNKNLGKAEALRSGVLSISNISDYEYIGYFDADLSVPLSEIKNFLEVIEKYNYPKFILGMRIARLGANINRNLMRHYLGRIFATFTSIILKEPVYDTQCGAKLIHSSIVVNLFKDRFISKWLFDVELLSRYKKLYPKCIDQVFEHPIMEWNEISGSKLKIKHYLIAPFELFKIWLTYRKYLN